MMNSRNQTGKFRVVSLSKNGGETWDSTYLDYNLPDPICEGSLLNIGTKKDKSILAFCNNDDKESATASLYASVLMEENPGRESF